jgi:two-component system response regulator
MSAEKLSIVVVEDNPADAELLRLALARTDVPLDMILFSNGEDAFRHLGIGDSVPHDSNCDLVVLDLNLPRISGFEILEEIRRTEHLNDVPVMILSGSSNPQDIQRCYQLGAKSYLCKPTDLPEILRLGEQLVASVTDSPRMVRASGA